MAVVVVVVGSNLEGVRWWWAVGDGGLWGSRDHRLWFCFVFFFNKLQDFYFFFKCYFNVVYILF